MTRNHVSRLKIMSPFLTDKGIRATTKGRSSFQSGGVDNGLHQFEKKSNCLYERTHNSRARIVDYFLEILRTTSTPPNLRLCLK